MAMNKSALSSKIQSIMTQMRKETEINDKKFADELADAIYSFILTAEVQPGIPVTTTGSATAQSGATTGAGKLL